mgnify:CR=1 FL=1
MKKEVAYLFLFLVFATLVLAHGDENDEIKSKGFFEDFMPLPFVILIFIISAVPFFIIAFYQKKISRQHIIFWILIWIVSSITLMVVFDTVNLTINSETKGPVHWHADYQIWSCDEQLDLVDPESIANRIGTRLFHEHGDKRMHVEGIIKKISDVDLHNFFNFVGGSLSENSFTVPTNDGAFNVNDGEFCNGEAGEVQIFAYVVTNPDPKQKSGFLVEQLKVNENYILSPYQDVPPGDCIIIEFDKRKDKTDKICDTYRIAVEQGRMVIV